MEKSLLAWICLLFRQLTQTADSAVFIAMFHSRAPVTFCYISSEHPDERNRVFDIAAGVFQPQEPAQPDAQGMYHLMHHL